MTKKQYNKKNQHRHELLAKDACFGITSEEMEELDKLTKECLAYVDKKYPMMWDKLHELMAELKRREEEVNKIKLEIKKIEGLHLPE
jgi:hypothetical protein